jgi:nitrite reductase (NADH) large subunit
MEELVMIGNGMAGVACLEQILKHNKKFDITIFGDETHANYNRILLSSVLAGERQADDITINGLDWYQTNNIGLRLGVRIVDVNSKMRTITGDDGSVASYDKLIIATGSRPFIPRIHGIDKGNVFTFRNLEDTREMLARAGKGRKAVVIGGGLLGLEAARGLQLRGCDVTVLHLVDRLMNIQLDPAGGLHLRRKIEELGVRVICNAVTTELVGNGHVEGVRLAEGGVLDADFVVVAAGIRPNAELGVKAGLKVNRGIVVNDYMETSDPNIFAVGECVEHNDEIFGLVAPLFEQGKVLAATISGNRGPVFTGWKPAAKLKIMGVDVFSAGNFEESPDVEVVRYEDAAMGVYKKLLVRNNRLTGVILVGDASDSNRYMEWLRHDADLVMHRRNLLFPEPVADHGEGVAEIADSETVCGCLGVSKGQIISAIHEKGINTMAQLKECTRASTGCGSCAATCQQILKAVAPQFEEETKKLLCSCVPFTQENLREMIRSQQLRSVQDVLDIYGNGMGCEVCKPALSYLVDVVWCGDHEEDRSARFINDRVHANIQNDGTFSVIPRIRGGVTTPSELRRIAAAAEKYNARMVKITGSQRIDLLGIKKADLPKIWADLGMPSGQAYSKGVRMVKTCVGTEFCRFGVQDAISAGVELERRLENLYTPHKTKMGVTGCPRNCAEVTVKDIGLVGQEGSWQVVVGGAAGKHVRKADLLITVETTEEALEAAALFFQYYRENANYLERTYDFVERLGIEKVRKETVYAPERQKKALLKRLQKAKALSSDAWLERQNLVNPTQFVQIEPLSQIPMPEVKPERLESVLQ